MPSIDFDVLLKEVIDAAKNSLSEKWPQVRDIATSSLKTISQNVIDIHQLLSDNLISEEQARLKMDIQKNAFKTLLLTEEGLGLLAVEKALNEIMKVVKKALNTALGLTLL